MQNELFEKMPIPKAYMKMALPVVMGMIVTLIYNLADTYFIAKTGNTDLIAGVSLCAPLFVIFSLVPSNLLRSEGKAMESMIGSVTGTVINIILDPIFIFALGLGAAGAAMATVIGYIATCSYLVYIIKVKSEVLSIDRKDFQFDGKTLAGVLEIVLPSSITNLMQTIGITLTNRFLLPYGDDQVAVMGIVLKIVNIAALVIVGLTFGGQPLIGYCYGAKLKKRMRRIIGFGMALTGGTGAACLAVLTVFSHPIIGSFLPDEKMIAQGSSIS